MRYAVVDKTTWTVVDVVMLEQALPEDDTTSYVPSASANIGYTYDAGAGTFSMSEPGIISLEAHRIQRLEELGEYLKYAEDMGVQYNGHWFATDHHSQVKLLAILMSVTMDPAFSTVFKTLNNEYVTLQQPDITGLCNAAKTYIATCYYVDSMHTEAIKGATTTEELNAIDLSQNWPNGPIDLNVIQSTKA